MDRSRTRTAQRQPAGEQEDTCTRTSEYLRREREASSSSSLVVREEGKYLTNVIEWWFDELRKSKIEELEWIQQQEQREGTHSVAIHAETPFPQAKAKATGTAHHRTSSRGTAVKYPKEFDVGKLHVKVNTVENTNPAGPAELSTPTRSLLAHERDPALAAGPKVEIVSVSGKYTKYCCGAVCCLIVSTVGVLDLGLVQGYGYGNVLPRAAEGKGDNCFGRTFEGLDCSQAGILIGEIVVTALAFVFALYHLWRCARTDPGICHIPSIDRGQMVPKTAFSSTATLQPSTHQRERVECGVSEAEGDEGEEYRSGLEQHHQEPAVAAKQQAPSPAAVGGPTHVLSQRLDSSDSDEEETEGNESPKFGSRARRIVVPVAHSSSSAHRRRGEGEGSFSSSWCCCSSDVIADSDGTVEMYRHWCSVCEWWRPPRSSHCRTCDVCVSNFDHHCGVLGICVGKRNIRHFVGFLIAVSICADCALFSACRFLYLVPDTEMGSASAIASIGLIIIALLSGIQLNFAALGYLYMYGYLGVTLREQKKKGSLYDHYDFAERWTLSRKHRKKLSRQRRLDGSSWCCDGGCCSSEDDEEGVPLGLTGGAASETAITNSTKSDYGASDQSGAAEGEGGHQPLQPTGMRVPSPREPSAVKPHAYHQYVAPRPWNQGSCFRNLRFHFFNQRGLDGAVEYPQRDLSECA